MMAFPRLTGYAEIGWTPSQFRNWEEYKVRLGKHGEHLKAIDISFYPSRCVPCVGVTLQK
jgi:hexosaminidase